MALSRKGWILVSVGVVLAAVIIGVIVCFVVRNSDSEVFEETYDGPTWGYKCEDSICKRVERDLTNINVTTSMNICHLTCGENIGTLLPIPSDPVVNRNRYMEIDLKSISANNNGPLNTSEYFTVAWNRFLEMQQKKVQDVQDLKTGSHVVVIILADTADMTLNYETYEGYRLRIYQSGTEIHVNIFAENFYGIRHALETLSQLIVYDDFENTLVLPIVEIMDEPKFPHRGISLDTSRNFYPVSAIKRTINGLAMVKLNTFHWHITDSQSLPFEIKSHPELTKLGAYSPDKVYTHADIYEVVEFAKSRGVRVIPEFDTPAHVGEGWQNTGFVVCYKEPSTKAQWRGHFNPTKHELFDVLEDIYGELVDSFKPSILHMGADEVNINCWNTTEIRGWMTENGMSITEEGFMDLWGYFQSNAVARLDKVLDHKIPLIVWTSSLTEDPYLTKLLDKERYIVQVWLDGKDSKIKTLLERGYKVILSNSDALYLDCGVGSWVSEGLNWCAPYKTWQTIYENKIENIAGEYVDQVYGSEAAIWSESIDATILDYRIWPRASALAERLWSDPKTHWSKAEHRILINREILVKIGGLSAEMFQPEWCLQNQGLCPS